MVRINPAERATASKILSSPLLPGRLHVDAEDMQEPNPKTNPNTDCRLHVDAEYMQELLDTVIIGGRQTRRETNLES